MQQQNRPLTYDERKAAEAAFRGAPFDPQLSESARKVYLGISSAMANKRNEAFQDYDLSQMPDHGQKSVNRIAESIESKIFLMVISCPLF